MIICSLATLMANRKQNISEVSRNTGISRTTLTALYYNDFKGIQCTTLNALCRYFNVTADKLLHFSRYETELQLLSWDMTDKDTVLFTIGITAADGALKGSADIRGAVYIYNSGKEAEIYADEYAEPPDLSNRADTEFVKKIISSMDEEYKEYINGMIRRLVSENLDNDNIRITSFKGL